MKVEMRDGGNISNCMIYLQAESPSEGLLLGVMHEKLAAAGFTVRGEPDAIGIYLFSRMDAETLKQ